MISSLFHGLFYDPLYNLLVFVIQHVPGGDVGLATIIVTLIVKLILFPLSKQATKTQLKMKVLEPEIAKIKEKYGSNREEFGRKTLEFYRNNQLNPFASFFLILLQLPVIIALAYIFISGGLPTIKTDILYSFIQIPTAITTLFLGFVDVGGRSIILSIIAGLAQFVQIRLSVPAYTPSKDPSKNPSFGDDLAKSMNVQMRYVMPVFMFFVCLSVSGAVALYWITGSLFTIAQELYFRKNIKKTA
ncbi:MAG: YidC/Oxa1 family membrane protein insertase [Candidatus Pacebacteria bacterium]|nr:YidC/Oxa1 family membrane protein insertase [Candidatus Paceibacterota bacterium]